MDQTELQSNFVPSIPIYLSPRPRALLKFDEDPAAGRTHQPLWRRGHAHEGVVSGGAWYYGMIRSFERRKRLVACLDPLILLQQRLHLLRDAREHILRRVLWHPSNRPPSVSPRSRVRPPCPKGALCAPEVFNQFVGGERCRLGVVRNPMPDEDMPDSLADLVPGVLSAFPEIEAAPAVPGSVRIAHSGVKDHNVQVGHYGVSGQ